jgi:hypothetical protein
MRVDYLQTLDLIRGEAAAVGENDGLVVSLEQPAPLAVHVEHGAQPALELRHADVSVRGAVIPGRHGTQSLMYARRIARSFAGLSWDARRFREKIRIQNSEIAKSGGKNPRLRIFREHREGLRSSDSAI